MRKPSLFLLSARAHFLNYRDGSKQTFTRAQMKNEPYHIKLSRNIVNIFVASVILYMAIGLLVLPLFLNFTTILSGLDRHYFYYMRAGAVPSYVSVSILFMISFGFREIQHREKIKIIETRHSNELVNIKEKLDEQYLIVNQDLITGIPIQGVFNEHVGLMLERFKATDAVRLQFSVALLDLKDFRNINNKYGLEVGDKYLREIAQLISESIRKSEHIYRHVDDNSGLYRKYKTGDEFLIILYGTELDVLFFLRRLKTRVFPDNSPRFGKLIGEPALQPEFYAAVKQVYSTDTRELIMEMLNQALVHAKSKRFGRSVVWASGKEQGEYAHFVKAFET